MKTKGKRKQESPDGMGQIERAKFRQSILLGKVATDGVSGFSDQLKEFLKEDLDWDKEEKENIIKRSYNRAKSVANNLFKKK